MDSFCCNIPKNDKVSEQEMGALIQRIQITELAAIDTYRSIIDLAKYNGFNQDLIDELNEIRQDEIDHQMKLQHIAESLDPSLAVHKETID